MENEFCKECNNILYFKEDKSERSLYMHCKSCEYTEESKTNTTYSTDYSFKSMISNTISPEDLVNDCTLLRTIVKCNTCDNEEAVIYYGDEAEEEIAFVVYYICTNCYSMWFVNEDLNIRNV